MTSKLQSFLLEAGKQLGVEVVLDPVVRLPSGVEIRGAVLLPELGGDRGMLIVRSFDAVSLVVDELIDNGYGFSVLSEPGAEEPFDLESTADMFRDWGWNDRGAV